MMNGTLTPERLELLWVLIGFLTLLFAIIGFVVIRSARRSHLQSPTRIAEAAKRITSAPDSLLKTTTPSATPVPSSATPVPRSTSSVDDRKTRAQEPPPPVAAPREVQLSEALKSTQSHFWGRVKGLFGAGASVDLSDLEEILYTSDLGPQTVERLLGEIEPATKLGHEAVKQKLRSEFEKIFDEAQVPEPLATPLAHLKREAKPTVWMIVGVNGAGKTTSIGKIAAQLASQGQRVIVAAGDTFRAAAGAQLKVWTERAGTSSEGLGAVEIFHPEGVADPSAVAFDAVAKAKARGYDVVIIDTAGRLHTQAPLMDELKKIKRVLSKVIPEAPHETLIVLDANNGQNALHQAREFNQALGLTGVILTKMDGTAKGGVAVGLSHELKIPIRLIGVGEKVQDLRAFSSSEFIASILDEA